MDSSKNIAPIVKDSVDNENENEIRFFNDIEWEEIINNCPALKQFFEVAIPAANNRNEVVGTTMLSVAMNY